MSRRTDIYISGQGFYTIEAQTKRGGRFMQEVQGAADGVALLGDGRTRSV